jgi:hypothetical protein
MVMPSKQGHWQAVVVGRAVAAAIASQQPFNCWNLM